MRKTILISLVALCMTNSYSIANQMAIPTITPEKTAVFSSSDKLLEESYNWAKKMALSYSHDNSDPVGYWYEAALPQREAFCMRDVSHQTVGAQIIGLTKHNKNMLTRFAENISEAKDWCSYWEINRSNKPAPVDYTNDQNFWYNLNANFDVMQACLKMYEWTGDTDYINDPCFTNFYDKSLNEYVKSWKLEPENIMNRPRYMNVPKEAKANKNFHTSRGLASYVENMGGLTASADLISTLYAGHIAHSEIATLNGDKAIAQRDKKIALQYRQILEDTWWDETNAYYQTLWTEDKKFHRGEGAPFILWFNVTENPKRIRATVSDILKQEWNVENISSFPALFYRYGYEKEAYTFLTQLPRMKRADYPEVSFGVVEGVVGGAMGIQPSAQKKQIITQSHIEEGFAAIENVPVFKGYISVRHEGKKATEFTNNTGEKIVWRASFAGKQESVLVNGKKQKATIAKDILGNSFSYVNIELANNKTCKVNF
ncbi:MAG: hypothetical protein PHI48_05225 [Bacteroidales bacterium]|nr:hypothetical protein [Bacteroidales bacterium]MDD4821942.1 hypothetical protein [Bacteroidales bacterium]